MSPELSNEEEDAEPERGPAAGGSRPVPRFSCALTAWVAGHRLVAVAALLAVVLLAGLPVGIRLHPARRPAR